MAFRPHVLATFLLGTFALSCAEDASDHRSSGPTDRAAAFSLDKVASGKGGACTYEKYRDAKAAGAKLRWDGPPDDTETTTPYCTNMETPVATARATLTTALMKKPQDEAAVKKALADFGDACRNSRPQMGFDVRLFPGGTIPDYRCVCDETSVEYVPAKKVPVPGADLGDVVPKIDTMVALDSCDRVKCANAVGSGTTSFSGDICYGIGDVMVNVKGTDTRYNIAALGKEFDDAYEKMFNADPDNVDLEKLMRINVKFEAACKAVRQTTGINAFDPYLRPMTLQPKANKPWLVCACQMPADAPAKRPSPEVNPPMVDEAPAAEAGPAPSSSFAAPQPMQ